MNLLRLECSCIVFQKTAVLPQTSECIKKDIKGTTET